MIGDDIIVDITEDLLTIHDIKDSVELQQGSE